MFEMIISAYRWIFLQMSSVFGLGWSIVLLSCICSALMAPLMRAVAGIVRREADYQSVILPQIAAIKVKYASDMDRHAHIQALYERYGYSPLSAVKKVLPLFVQIPFLLLTYFMLKGTAELSGVEFLFLGNLGGPDAILHLRLLPSPINLLPFVMTGVNLITVFATPGFTARDRTQAIAIALLFLVMLYTAPSALLLYWTLNNVITMVRTLLAKNGEGLRLLVMRTLDILRMPARIRIPSPRGLAWDALLVVRNFAILNICLLPLTLVVIFGFMPDRLDVQLEAKRPISVGVGFVATDADGKRMVEHEQFAGCSNGPKADPVRYFFANDFDEGSFTLKFSGADLNFKIKSIGLVRNLLLRYRLPLEAFGGECRSEAAAFSLDSAGGLRVTCDKTELRLMASEGWKTKFEFAGVELPDLPGVSLCPWLFEMMLLALAVMGLWMGAHDERKGLWVKSAALAVAGALFFVVVLPCQSIFTNRAVFDFAVGDIILQLGLATIAWALAFFVVLRLTAIVFGCWPHVLFFAVLVFEYLQTGVLAMGFPSLDGNLMFYMNRSRGMLHLAVMAGIIVVVMAFARRIRHHVVLLSGIFSILSLISLFESQAKMHSGTAGQKKDEIPWRLTGRELVQGIRLSPEKNVILLVPDSMQSDSTFNVISHDEKLRADYEGFCAFNNNIGMHAFTQVGITGLLTGKYCSDPKPGEAFSANYMRYSMSSWAEGSVPYDYESAGYPVYLMPGIFGAHSNRIRVPERNRRESLGGDSVFCRRSGPMGLCLLDCLRFRLVPFILKQWSMRVSMLGITVDDGTHEERTLYPNLSGNPLGEERKAALVVLHTNGSHMPIHYDENGNRLWKDKDNYKGMCGQTHFVLKCIAGFLEGLKKQGIYDKSLIVIVGDHGSESSTTQWPGLSHVPSRAIPMLWVKPIGARGAFSTSDIPTSHSKIADLLKRSRVEDLSLDAIGDILRTPVRYFRNALDYQTEFKDYYFDANCDANCNIVKPEGVRP